MKMLTKTSLLLLLVMSMLHLYSCNTVTDLTQQDQDVLLHKHDHSSLFGDYICSSQSCKAYANVSAITSSASSAYAVEWYTMAGQPVDHRYTLNLKRASTVDYNGSVASNGSLTFPVTNYSSSFVVKYNIKCNESGCGSCSSGGTFTYDARTNTSVGGGPRSCGKEYIPYNIGQIEYVASDGIKFRLLPYPENTSSTYYDANIEMMVTKYDVYGTTPTGFFTIISSGIVSSGGSQQTNLMSFPNEHGKLYFIRFFNPDCEHAAEHCIEVRYTGTGYTMAEPARFVTKPTHADS